MLRKLELVILILIIAGFVFLNRNLVKLTATKDVDAKKWCVVLDAGHGGADPGKIGVNGILEKDINLQIAEKVKEILEKKGVSVVMTREADIMLGGNPESTKAKDMKERVEIINDVAPDIAVSIHQNSYTDSSISGAQVFYYSGSEEGEQFAMIMQSELLELDTNNHRQAKANDNYYLLTRTKVPTIIVECGFLSNEKEAEKLSEKEYQEEISNAIVRGIESCFMN